MKCGAVHPQLWAGTRRTLCCLGIVVICAWLACDSIAEESAPSESLGRARKSLLVHYMPWFVSQPIRGEWGNHWTGNRKQFDPSKMGEGGLPDIAAHYHPLLGPYDSSDPNLIECHLLQMKLAGIDGMIVDWYGLGQYGDYPQSHVATQAVFEAAGKFGLKFAVCYEDRTIEHLIQSGKLNRDHIAEHLAETFGWLDENWFSGPQYFKVADQPLLLNFGPMFVKDSRTWQQGFALLAKRPRLFALNHLWKNIGADGGFTWVYPQVWKGSPSAQIVQERLRAEYTQFFRCSY